MEGIHVIFGAGPIGLATMDALLDRGHQVRVVSRSGSAQVPDGVEVMAGDASSAEFAASAVANASSVYQVLNPPYHQWAELFPPLQDSLVGAARGVGARYVSFENLYMYGDPKGKIITEDSPINIHTRKGKVRNEMAESLAALNAAGDLAVATARASDYFGPRATWQSQLGERVVGRAIDGKPAQVVGDPDTLHSFSYTKDTGRVLATLGTDDRAVGEVWHIPNAPAETMRSMIRMLGDELGLEIKVSAAPSWLLKVMGLFNKPVRELDEMMYAFTSDYIATSDKFSGTFGIDPSPMETAIEETAAWWRSARAG